MAVRARTSIAADATNDAPTTSRLSAPGSMGVQSRPRPCSRARMIASARSATSSLAKMLVRLLLTVLGER